MAPGDIKGKNILVIGGAGFVGSHLVESLAEDNRVVVLDNLLYGSRENLIGFRHEFVEADIRDCDLSGLIASRGIDLVYHLATYRLSDSLEDPFSDFLVTGLGGMRVLEACRGQRVARLVFTSTGSVYGEPRGANHDEGHPLLPTTPYGVSKTAIDHYCRVYQDIYGLETVRLRYYNIYGPRRLAGVVPQFILQALRGDDIVIQGGDQTRTPTFVEDVVEMTRLAGWRPEAAGQAYNVAAHRYISVRDLAELIIDRCGAPKRSRLVFTGYRPGEILHLQPNVDKAFGELGWRAFTGIEQGLDNMIGYIRRLAESGKLDLSRPAGK